MNLETIKSRSRLKSADLLKWLENESESKLNWEKEGFQ